MITKHLGVAALAMLTVASASSARAADAKGNFAIRGAGTVSCTDYINATPEQKIYAQTWWAGYLTAMNRVTPDTYNLLGRSSIEDADNWLLTYCRQNPNERFATAVHEMLKALYPSRTQSGR